MGKYLVLTTCHTHGRMCKEGQVIEIDGEVNNKHLKLVDGDVTKKEKSADAQSYSGIANASRDPIKTGMAAPSKTNEAIEAQLDAKKESAAGGAEASPEAQQDAAVKEATDAPPLTDKEGRKLT